MKILVLSDSHSSMRFMRQCVERVQPDAIVHLGDHYDDGLALAEEYPHIRMHQVPGNCDRFRCPPGTHEILCYDIGGVRIYMTHGHRHNVKYDLNLLLENAKSMKAAAVLYGHTHTPAIEYFSEGENPFYLFNPGSIGSREGSYGIITLTEGQAPLFSHGNFL